MASWERPSKVGVGVIGTGGISRSHVRGYREFPDRCEIVAVADIDETKAKSAAEEFGPKVAWYRDYEEMLKRDDIHLVSVCTPPFVHAPAAIAALQAGKHVLVEKPMAASLQEADEMIRAAESHDRILGVVFQYRYFKDRWLAKAVIDSGLLGPLLIGKADCLWYRGPSYYNVWWRGTWEMESGGATINHAVHDIDTLLWFMGEPESVWAELFTLNHDIEVEDLSLAAVRFRSGAAGQITSTVSSQQSLSRLEVSGDYAGVSLPWRISAFRERPNGFGMENVELREKIEAFVQGVEAPKYERHAPTINDMLQAILDGGSLLVDGKEGRRSLELITGIYKSGSTREVVTFPLTPDDPFYTLEGLRANVKRHPSSKRKAGSA